MDPLILMRMPPSFRPLSVVVLAGLAIAAASAAPLGPADFLKTDGPVIRNASGTGRVLNLRGTNIGGWLMHEGWMSPNGYGAVARDGWAAPRTGHAAVLDGDPATAWRARADDTTLELGFGRHVAFDRIALVAGKDAADAPLEVHVSLDGATWTPVKPTRRESVDGELRIYCDNVYTARHLRLRPADGVAVAEVHLHQNDDYTTRRTLQRRFGRDAADALLDGYQAAWFTAADLDRIESWGMNVLRVPLNWLEFMEPDGSWKAGAWRELDWVIAECGARGLYVILDLHAVPGGASPWASSGHAGDDGRGQNPNGFWNNPRFLELTIDLWVRVAERYRGNPAVAGYDLINEPLWCFDERPKDGEKYSEAALRKAAVLDRIYRAVRAVDPDHIIFIPAYTVAPPDNTAYIGTPSGFWGITPPSHHGWTNVVYQTHHYDMPNSKDWAAQNRLVEDALKDIAHHQREWNVPMFAGEYSLYAFYDVWAKWMAGLNALNASWTNWTYKIRGTPDEPAGGDWGFFNSNTNPVPDITRDSAEEIAAKWTRFGTEAFVPNLRLIEVVSRHAREPERAGDAPAGGASQ